MKIIYRLHNNLPHNNKAVAVYEQLRNLVGVEYEPQEEREVVDVDVLGKSGCAKCYRGAYHAELVDALYDMIIKLKEEKVI